MLRYCGALLNVCAVHSAGTGCRRPEAAVKRYEGDEYGATEANPHLRHHFDHHREIGRDAVVDVRRPPKRPLTTRKHVFGCLLVSYGTLARFCCGKKCAPRTAGHTRAAAAHRSPSPLPAAAPRETVPHRRSKEP